MVLLPDVGDRRGGLLVLYGGLHELNRAYLGSTPSTKTHPGGSLSPAGAKRVFDSDIDIKWALFVPKRPQSSAETTPGGPARAAIFASLASARPVLSAKYALKSSIHRSKC